MWPPAHMSPGFLVSIIKFNSLFVCRNSGNLRRVRSVTPATCVSAYGILRVAMVITRARAKRQARLFLIKDFSVTFYHSAL